MGRLSDFLLRFASVLSAIAPADVEIVKEAYRAAKAAFEKLKSDIPGHHVPPLGEFYSKLPPTLASIGGEFRQAVDREVAYRGQEWAHKYLHQAIVNFVPQLEAAPDAPPAGN